MDFASVTREPKVPKKSTKTSPKATKCWTRLDVAITPTGTIKERRMEETKESVRAIYEQLDFCDEAKKRVDGALEYLEKTDTDFFTHCEKKFSEDTSTARFVSCSEWAWFDAEAPPEAVSIPDYERTLSPEEFEECETSDNIYAECDVCGENDGGASKCGCIHVVMVCTFITFDGAPGSFLVPRSVPNVPVEILEWLPSVGDVCSGRRLGGVGRV